MTDLFEEQLCRSSAVNIVQASPIIAVPVVEYQYIETSRILSSCLLWMHMNMKEKCRQFKAYSEVFFVTVPSFTVPFYPFLQFIIKREKKGGGRRKGKKKEERNLSKTFGSN